jgi:hypothetical protein
MMATAWERERAEMVEAFRKDLWTRQKWTRLPALVAKDGSEIACYYGQDYDPEKFDLVPDGWGHDHCELCFKTITDFVREDARAPVVDEGYINSDECWVCCACFSMYLDGRLEREQ